MNVVGFAGYSGSGKTTLVEQVIMALKQQGALIPTNDTWIAPAALENGGRIIAYDHHSEAVAGVMVEAP